jgi:hypothetical protein
LTGLLAHYEAADPAVRDAGRQWYPNALALCSAIGSEGVPVDTVARVMGILSPRVSWRWCVEWTLTMVNAYLDGLPCPAVSTTANREKAWRELHGEAAMSGPKASAFAAAILGDTDAVVIDSWTLRSVGLSPKAKVTAHRQRWITSAYAEAALLAGETPRDMQAIVWCAIRGAAT